MRTRVVVTMPSGWQLVELYNSCDQLFSTLWTKGSRATFAQKVISDSYTVNAETGETVWN